jgi:WD40 repeat-containing protein SMU1
MDPSASSSSLEQFYTVSAAEILRLIQAHLMECGLHQTVRTLQRESGIGMAASLQSTPWKQLAMTGQWASVLQGLASLDKERMTAAASGDSSLSATAVTVTILLASVHEMAILELADIGEWETAYAVFRLFQQDEAMSAVTSELSFDSANQSADLHNSKSVIGSGLTVSRSLEQKLAALAAARQANAACVVPDDYYGIPVASSQTATGKSPSTSRQTIDERRQARRTQLGERLQDFIPKQPPQRLLLLLQQAIKWQSYTGQLPNIRQKWEELDEATSIAKRKRVRTFDLVLGEASVDPTSVGNESSHSFSNSKGIAKEYAKIKFGKQAVCQAAAVLPDGSGLVTGSSDGWIEFWDWDGKLRTKDLVYQQNDELLGHDNGAAISALAVSNDTAMLASSASDGTVNIWKIQTGQRLRSLLASSSANRTGCDGGSISALSFSPDNSRVLVALHDGTCREFGLRTARILKEFRGHSSYVTSCSYELVVPQAIMLPGESSTDAESRDQLRAVIITSSGDGTIRIWDGTTADPMFMLRPVSIGLLGNLSSVASSICSMDNLAFAERVTNSGSPAVNTVLKLHTPRYTLLVVPRGQRAFLVDYRGTVLQTFQDERNEAASKTAVFVAAAVSVSNRWFYAVQDSGVCCIFDVATGKLDKTIPDFGSICTSATSTEGLAAEVTTLVHHPYKEVVAAFSNDRRQKKGKVVLWK